MSSRVGGIGSTLTGGIQDIAAILPLLGTEQCSIHVSSALTRGYLYAASAPMSIFGSLGVVSAGFKTLVACFSYGDIEGAKILGNMGFEPQGENLSLIMVETGKGKNSGCYIIENRIDELIDELNIDKNRIIGVSHKSAAWNIKMIATTALLCVFSIVPYIYINLGANSLNLKKGTIWVFPILRSTGGFITATLIQLLIQRRITTLSHQYLVKLDQLRSRDLEEGGDTKKFQMIARRITPTWLLLFLLLIGLLASVVGYVGCFSVVQNSVSTSGPLSWLCLEVGLSIMRLAIWAWNPMTDDAPPLQIILELDKYEHKPLPTCNKDHAEILKYKVLPLTRARDFLRIITSFAGLIVPFSNSDLSLYYTLTRNRNNKLENAENHKLGERTLFITVFDHKERTTRVYTRDNEIDTFYSTKSDAPYVDVGHSLLEVEIDDEIVDPKGDPVCSDNNILVSLRYHHQSILENIQYRLGAANVTKTYAINNRWTMKVDQTVSTLQRLREENGDVWKRAVEKGLEEERTEESLVSDYFIHSSIERERQLLDEKRGRWITRRMEKLTKETKERLLGMGVEYRVNKQAVERKPETKSPEEVREMLGREHYFQELLLVCEVMEWEKLFWKKFNAFLDKIGNDRVEEKDRMTREWRANCWKRLDHQMHAALKRVKLADAISIEKSYYLEMLCEQWAKSIGQLFEGVENPDLISLSNFKEWIKRVESEDIKDEEIKDEGIREFHLRMKEEILDTQFRLKRGSDLGRFDQFWDDDLLFDCRYSRLKWVFIRRQSESVPLEIYSHALKGNKNITHITFGYMDPDFDVNQLLRDLPWVTSISPYKSAIIPAIPRDSDSDPLFIKTTNDDLNTFAKEFKLDNSSTYIFSHEGSIDVYFLMKPGRNARIFISFVAPTSAKRLILRVKHSGEKDRPLEVTLGSTKIQLNPESKSSLTIDDLTLYPIEVPGPSESDHLSFEPGVRNDIDIRFIVPQVTGSPLHGHFLHDVELLDEDGLEYMSHSASLSRLSN